MTVNAYSTSQRRSLPTARRSPRALTSPRPKIHSKPPANAKPAPAHGLTGSPSLFPPTRLRATGLRADARAPSAILKSP